MAAAVAHHHTPTAITIHTPPSPSTPLYTLVTTTPPSPPRPPQQWWLFQPLPPSWRTMGDGSGLPAAKPPSWWRLEDGTPPQPHLVVSSCDGATPWGVSQ
nr:hypothetical protein [Tanacetum cinerariifolium]